MWEPGLIWLFLFLGKVDNKQNSDILTLPTEEKKEENFLIKN
jgi:hypothetical protein